jgi:7-carboxy-7-deazaguanine synthase
LTGTDSIFVRSSGCNLRCGFCDTPYTSWQPEGQHRAVDEIVQQCRQHDCDHIVLTGGEPMLQREVVPLTRRLADLGYHLTIETAGTVDRPVACDLMSISPKLANSVPARARAGYWTVRHERLRHRPAIVRNLMQRYPWQLKFVVDQPTDCRAILDYLRELPAVSPQRVLVMPEGVQPQDLAEKEAWIEPFCRQHGFQLCRRMHIVWFGNRRGT